MSESIGVVAGRRRSRDEAERLVMEFEQSGLTRRVFCAQHGLAVATLASYRKRGRGAESGPMQAQAKSRILPVEFMAGTQGRTESRAALWVELANGRRIEVAHGFDAATLERLIATLERA